MDIDTVLQSAQHIYNLKLTLFKCSYGAYIEKIRLCKTYSTSQKMSPSSAGYTKKKFSEKKIPRSSWAKISMIFFLEICFPKRCKKMSSNKEFCSVSAQPEKHS